MNGPDRPSRSGPSSPGSGGAPASRTEPARGCGWVARTALAFLLCAGASAAASAAGDAGAHRRQGDDFMVIVNAANPAAELPAAEVSRFFLKHVVRWPSGERLVPIDLPPSSPVRERFSQAIHKRSVAMVAAYWQTMIFSGRNVPPPEEPSPATIVGFVAAAAGAIAYVPAGTPLPQSVKVLKVLP
jgi:hypothetical protein